MASEENYFPVVCLVCNIFYEVFLVLRTLDFELGEDFGFSEKFEIRME